MSSKFVLQQEDGTAAGGNARGENAIDLGLSRTFAYQVASGKESIAIGNLVTAAGTNRGIAIGYNVQARTSGIAIGDSSSATPDYAIAIGRTNNILDNAGVAVGNNLTAHGRSVALGNNNSATHYDCFVAGQSNTASSQYSTVSGGQSNTATSNTHATVVGGQNNVASGLWAVAAGIQSNATGQSSICLGSESAATGVQSYVLGRLCHASGSGSLALGFGASTNSKSYSNVFGGGGKSGNNNENVFANSVSQTNEGISQQTGYYQRRFQIVGANSQNKGAFTPTGRTIQSATTWALSTTFNFVTIPSPYPTYSPLYDNVYFTFESTITMAVNIVNGTATGVSVGDYKIGKLLATGKKYGGAYTVISTNFTVIDESASMGTSTFELTVASAGNFYIKFTAPTFTGGGDLDLTIMADNTITEMKQNL